MIRVWKEVLLPCQRQYDARGREFSITSANVRDAYRNVKLMLSRGVPLPCIAEHLNVEAGDTDAWRAKYVRDTFGHISDARLSGSGSLELCHDLRDAEAVKIVNRCRYVSPKIYPSYADSKGGRYRGTTIAHVAVTPTPVQFWQKPFQLSKGGLYLAYSEAAPAGRKPRTCTPDTVRSSNARALSTTPAGGSTVADEVDDATDTGGDLGALIEALRGTGMTIPDEVTDIAGLVIAVKAAGGAKPGADDDMDLDGDGLDLDAPTAAAGGAPGGMMMSVTDPNPVVANRVKVWQRYEKKDANGRVKALFASGRIDRPTALQLLRQLHATEMSFTGEAVAVYPLANKLADLEKRVPNSVWAAPAAGRDLSSTRLVPAPTDFAGTSTADDENNPVLKLQRELAKQHSVTPGAKK